MQSRSPRGSVRQRAQRAQKRRRSSWKKRFKTLIVLLSLGVLLPVGIGATTFLIIFYQVSRTLPDLAEIGSIKPSEGTRIYYADGPLMAVLASENRIPVKLARVDEDLVAATVAAEDKRFFEHKGVDYMGVVRALFRNVSGGDLTGQGASTITQQLARNVSALGLTREKRLRRKVAEAILAMKMEQTFNKEEILELYLNQIYYGNGAYGVEAAARSYFGKSCRSLTLVEAATLAGIPQRPSLFATDADARRARRDWVLGRMLETRRITREEYDRAVVAEPRIRPRVRPTGTHVYSAPYVVNYVVSLLERSYGPDAVYSGWRIVTTLDSRMQKAAERVIRNGIGNNAFGANQGCLVALDPRTGHIRAMVGGVDFKKNQFNAVVQGRRQPGSAFKPIVYTAAIDRGVCDLHESYRDDPYFQGRHRGNKWLPQNYGGGYSGSHRTVLSAIKFSVNTIAVKVAMEVGLDAVVDYAKRMGIHSELAKYPPLALGASAVRPIELATAYSVLAYDGKLREPTVMVKVSDAQGEDLGESEFASTPQETGIQPGTLQAMNEALQQVVLSGTGTTAASVPQAHGKTGTTSDNRDAWFAGYTPDLVAVVWAGREQRDRQGKATRYLPMPGATGGQLCAPMWRNFMLEAAPIQQQVNKAATRAAAPPDPVEEERKDEKPKPPSTRSPQVDDNAAPAVTPDDLEQEEPSTGATTPPEEPRAEPGASEPAPEGPSVGQGQPAAPLLPVTRGGATGAPRPSEGSRSVRPSERIAPPAVSRPSPPSEDTVTVSLCADSMRRASVWCPATIERRLARRSVPGSCRVHRPPPGER